MEGIFLILSLVGLGIMIRGIATGSIICPGRTMSIKKIDRDQQPGLFWGIVLFWVFFTGLMLINAKVF